MALAYKNNDIENLEGECHLLPPPPKSLKVKDNNIKNTNSLTPFYLSRSSDRDTRHHHHSHRRRSHQYYKVQPPDLVGLVISWVSLNNNSSFSPISSPCGANCLTLRGNLNLTYKKLRWLFEETNNVTKLARFVFCVWKSSTNVLNGPCYNYEYGIVLLIIKTRAVGVGVGGGELSPDRNN